MVLQGIINGIVIEPIWYHFWDHHFDMIGEDKSGRKEVGRDGPGVQNPNRP
jgi:hypothetical protein